MGVRLRGVGGRGARIQPYVLVESSMEAINFADPSSLRADKQAAINVSSFHYTVLTHSLTHLLYSLSPTGVLLLLYCRDL